MLFLFTYQGYILCLEFVKIHLSFQLVVHSTGFDWQWTICIVWIRCTVVVTVVQTWKKWLKLLAFTWLSLHKYTNKTKLQKTGYVHLDILPDSRQFYTGVTLAPVTFSMSACYCLIHKLVHYCFWPLFPFEESKWWRQAHKQE